ncbi:ribulose-phosphate 3-epimerase [Pseudobacteriovorax antillogorgiicola]|uniref:Ribulose-phosphate 3-epimerase n=1 Tax=Pseudobacteriovorax antillogorgiicola TaxID=1513793 RepID=A0A1Y6B3J0_9BACT|nr:ribulose-phosphate 3-epimerase [Pseudobacteriovorax antillogorgiicola]TCS59292.1 ribulose-5-phosphate 3-epimerase [Pseudobacteriovorax antillogorgiicola]SME89682.1 ribulose-5-phosphate 3-epimerase [Pseudobacteriovorax antillogorgiicola]
MSAQDIWVAPSLLAADPLNFETESKSVEDAGADLHHVDVMDGHFVPNLTFGIPFVKALKKVSGIPLDVHIMISNPDEMAMEYVKAGADYLLFHVEAATHAHRLTQVIAEAGAKPGLAINPGTSLSLLEPLLPFVKMINVMSVNPGFGGQKFIRESLSRISWLRNEIEKRSLDMRIQVDGGVNKETVGSVVEAGADVLVAGTAVYGASDRKAAIELLKNQNS